MAFVHCAILAKLPLVTAVEILNMNATPTIAGFASGRFLSVAGLLEAPGLPDRAATA